MADDIRTIKVEIPVSDFHAQMVDVLEDEGVDICEQVANHLQEQTEQTIHAVYQQARHSIGD